MIREVLEALLAGEELSEATMEECFVALMSGAWSEPQQAAFLVALRAKGETPGELAAAARVLRRLAVPVVCLRQPVVDTCGTGGDGSGSLNISTGAALVAASCGVAVAKHGNRSISSRCGSADVLEALGVPLELEAEALGTLLDRTGFAFLFAPRLHPAMRAVMPVRRALAVRTLFNLLGPLANPAGVQRQVVGVFSAQVQPLVAETLARLGCEHAWVVHSEDGLDEISVSAPTVVVEVRGGRVTGRWSVDPQEVGAGAAAAGALAGGSAAENAARLLAILRGEESGAAADAVALNAGAALVVAGTVASLEEGFAAAQDALARGAAWATLQQVIAVAGELR